VLRLQGVNSEHLRDKPIKIPSGHYNESLRVERTQQDLNNDMVQELLDLQPLTAYVKAAAGKAKIQTPLFAPTSTSTTPLVDMRLGAMRNAIDAKMLKKRSDIEEEIRERQGQWRQGGGNEPPTNSGGNSPPSLPSATTGEDDEPPPISYVPSTPSEETSQTPPGKKHLPLELVSLNFFESGQVMPAHGERQYSTRFSRHTARFVSIELTIRMLLEKERSTRVRVKSHFLNPDGSLYKRQEEDYVVYADKDSRPYQWGFGAAQPGSWQHGEYRVVIFINGVQFAEESFTITKEEGMVAHISAATQPPGSERKASIPRP
jgi:hypothetical protein